MNLLVKKISLATASLFVLSGLMVFTPVAQDAFACGWRNSGGQAFGPGQNNYKSFNQSAAISKEQALVIVTQHVQKLNPDLKIGNVNDAGPLYEAEILSADEEVLQVLGVYKQSGQVVVVN